MARKKKTVDLDRDQDIAPGLVAKTKKRLVVVSGRSHPALADEVAEALGTELAPTEHRTFASGEIYTRFEVSIRGCDVFVIQSFGHPVNEWLMELLIMLDAAQARLGQAHHRRRAVLSVLASGQEGPRTRADQRPPRRRPAAHGRRRPRHERRPARRADPGLLRRPRRPPLRQARAAGVLPADAVPGRPREAHGRLARHGPRPRRRHLVGQPRRAAGDHPQASRPEGREPGLGARDRR